jgi:hypothetical protein
LPYKADELVRYITTRVVNYMETPIEERREHRKLHRTRQAWLFRWFGVVPFALSMWLDERKNKKKLKRQRR